MDFANKTVLVTGAAAGIGRAVSEAFARQGANVVVSDIADSAGEETAERIRSLGAQAIFVQTDVADSDQCARLVDRTMVHFGQLDAAVNNAGIVGPFHMVRDYPVDAWGKVIAVNLIGVFNCLAPELRAMAGRGGAIVNMASILGLVGRVGVSSYCAAKHGVIGLTKASALEAARDNIRVNAVCPGFVETRMSEGSPQIAQEVKRNAIRRLGLVDEVAEMVLWLCSDRASFVTGAAFPVDGGSTAS